MAAKGGHNELIEQMKLKGDEPQGDDPVTAKAAKELEQMTVQPGPLRFGHARVYLNRW